MASVHIGLMVCYASAGVSHCLPDQMHAGHVKLGWLAVSLLPCSITHSNDKGKP